MANPRYLSREGESTVELLMKLHKAKKIYFENLESFCEKEFIDKKSLENIDKVYLIGSHADESKWDDKESDLDIAIVNFLAIPENLFRYKHNVLNPILCSSSRKRDWIDLYFLREDYQVTEPRWDITKDWNILKINP